MKNPAINFKHDIERLFSILYDIVITLLPVYRHIINRVL